MAARIEKNLTWKQMAVPSFQSEGGACERIAPVAAAIAGIPFGVGTGRDSPRGQPPIECDQFCDHCRTPL